MSRGKTQHDQSQGLVGERGMQINLGKQRRYPDNGLQQHQMKQDERSQRMRRCRLAATGGNHMPEGGSQNDIGAAAMNVLNKFGILKKIAPSRFDDEQIAGNDRTIHQRPGIITQTGVQPGHKSAEIDLDQHQEHDRTG